MPLRSEFQIFVFAATLKFFLCFLKTIFVLKPILLNNAVVFMHELFKWTHDIGWYGQGVYLFLP